jgi:hypothetical protein
VIPQCIQSAKELYDLRSRYKDASVLITAIYSESMVIAASLSQLQGLLQQDALKNKPLLHETFDRALTGCRVVYVCLDEEVRELAKKADNDNLKFKDRTKYLWKEDTFKELLQQIRGQQSALSLLLQGLQMESIADIKRLVQDNSARLDQIATRSNTLRKSRPNIKVPESVFEEGTDPQSIIDAEAILRSAEFDFDDEIVNSKAYRRAMALATFQAEGQEPVTSQNLTEEKCDEELSGAGVDLANLELKLEPEVKDTHAELLDSLEHSFLPFMPPSSENGALSPRFSKLPIVPSFEAISQEEEEEEEAPPPLPPRRPMRPLAESRATEVLSEARNSAFSNDSTSVFSAPSWALSKSSTVSSLTTMGSSLSNLTGNGGFQRKPLVLAHKGSYDTLFRKLPGDLQDVHLATSEDVDMNNIWKSLLSEERNFVDRMTKFRTTFYDNITKEWPVLENHLELIPVGEQIAGFHRQYILMTLEGQLAQGDFATCDPSLFETWSSKTNKIYREYCQRLPHAKSAILMTQNMDSKFLPYIETLGFGAALPGKSCEDYLTLPITQLDLYIETLRSLHKICLTSTSASAKRNGPRYLRVLEAVRCLKKSCLQIIKDSQDWEQIQNLHRRIHTLNADYLAQLNLLQPGRRILSQGMLARKKEGQGAWQAVHVVLLDNYLFWGMLKPPRSKSTKESKTRTKTKQLGDVWVLESVSPTLCTTGHS